MSEVHGGMGNMTSQEMDQMNDEVREQVASCPPDLLSPVVKAVVGAMRGGDWALDDAAIGQVLVTAVTAAARADVKSGEFLTAKSMALGLAAAGVQLQDEAPAGTSHG
ncbi:hypothetical protein OG705_29455 [Streptomyces sp. NBC_00838]|uniref:hypothetical protein n=1 Tax=Streptomyces sp. NBC_00838 TaxID=2903680 RepID=UPI00386CF7BC|nr:hypothetical protein OG705_29455 [Streptomyces sp. NBC_00838]